MLKGLQSIKVLFVAGLVPLSLGACMARDPSIRDDFGAAVRHNIAVQTINPDAGGEDQSQHMEGQAAESAVETYRTRPVEVESESMIEGVGTN